MKITLAALLLLIASLAFGQEEAGQVDVKYMGAKNYYAFTRLVFETGEEKPESFKISLDPIGKEAVLYPESGTMTMSFAPVSQVSEIVRGLDFTEDSGRRGIIIKLSYVAAPAYRISYLKEPGRIVLDFYDNEKVKGAGYLPLARPVRTVAVDPGHGGRSFGSARMQGTSEKELSMDVALRLRKALTARGFKVVLTREGDSEASAADRTGVANAARADLFISIHASGSFTGKGGGPAFYTIDAGELSGMGMGASRGPYVWSEQNAPYLPDSLRLARALIAAYGSEKGPAPELHQARLAGFEGLAMPAVMAELGNLDDPDQAAQLADDGYRNRIAGELAKGIEDFVARGVVQ